MEMIPFRFPGIEGVACAFTTRQCGNVSLDLAAYTAVTPCTDDKRDAGTVRRKLAHTFGAFAEAKQVHGTRTIFEAAAQDPALPSCDEADGLATTQAGLALMIKTADCQPILLAHESGRFVAALHAGWRGNRADYPGIAVRELCAHYKARPEELAAVRGPSLGPTAAEFMNFQGEWGIEFAPWLQQATQCMNLWALTRHQLEHAGLRPERIFSLDLCTWNMPDDFFSYRRFCDDSRLGGLTHAMPDGRQGSFIWRE